MKCIRVVIALLVLAFGTVTITTLEAQDRPGGAGKWEYRLLSKDRILELGKQDLVAGLNKLGQEGWELAGIDGVIVDWYGLKRFRDYPLLHRNTH